METSQAMIEELIQGIKMYSTVLEPSAGSGELALNIALKRECSVDCIDLNIKRVAELNATGVFSNIWHGDFLNWPEEAKYDYVIAVPPYRNNIDCQHIIKMYKCIKKGGEVRTFTLPYWVTGIYDNQKEFRQWLSDKDYTLKLFENDESYLSCPKMLLIIRK